MANLKPSDLPQVRSILDKDIFIVETDPNNIFNLSVNKIEKGDLFSGYLNDVTNIGLGETIYSGTSGTNILLKSLVQGPGLAISDRGQDLVISFTGSEESTTASNIGLGLGLISGTSNFDIKVKSISGGSNIQLSETDNTFVFDFTGQTEATTVSNIGAGVPLVSGISDVDVKVRSISGGSNISVENSGETVFVDFTGQTFSGESGIYLTMIGNSGFLENEATIGTGSLTTFIVTDSGKVGVNVSDPLYTFHVAGSTCLSGSNVVLNYDSLPKSNPNTEGRVWVDNGFLMISSG